jgi:tRNA(Ile)-lysidine synthase
VAYSGGVDSTVLLALLDDLVNSGRISAELLAIHINHGLNPASDHWERHCAGFCRERGIPFRAVRVTVTTLPGESLEMAARRERYRVFEAELPDQGFLLQGHHLGDQAETFLYRLMRGNGPAGLGGIPATRKLGRGTLLRPLLGFSRSEIAGYAQALGLTWIEDPSNSLEVHDRNYLRNSVLPILAARWPHAEAAISRTSDLCREAGDLLSDLAAIDLAVCSAPPGNRLQIEALTVLSEARQRNLLKYWLEFWSTHFGGTRVTWNLLRQATGLLVKTTGDHAGEVQWGRGRETLFVRRYRNHLYVLPGLPSCTDLHWDTSRKLQLPSPLGELSFEKTGGPGLDSGRLPALEVRFRAGGETIKPPGRPTRTVKNLMQEHGVPPWMRDHVPLLYHGNVLVAVGDLAASEDWWQPRGENNARLIWKRTELDCGY